MNAHQRRPLVLVQWLIWIILFVVHVLSLLPYDPVGQSVTYSVINIGFYAMIIYVNAKLLLPLLYGRGKIAAYVVCALLLIATAGFLRQYGLMTVYNRFFAEKPSPFRWSMLVSSLITSVLVYISSILFYIAMNFFRLRQKQVEWQKQHAEAQLRLLKAQVQPHFLFNTLNNIYFTAQRESPATAAMLEELSLMMRYFIDDAPKDRVTLKAELSFIRHYISLEGMRMRYPLSVTIRTENIAEDSMLPPMLLIPLVENVFKHGIDKRRDDNFIAVTVSGEAGMLSVAVENRLQQPVISPQKSGTGLPNLEARLALLYDKHYSLRHGAEEHVYRAKLRIPL